MVLIWCRNINQSFYLQPWNPQDAIILAVLGLITRLTGFSRVCLCFLILVSSHTLKTLSGLQKTLIYSIDEYVYICACVLYKFDWCSIQDVSVWLALIAGIRSSSQYWASDWISCESEMLQKFKLKKKSTELNAHSTLEANKSNFRWHECISNRLPILWILTPLPLGIKCWESVEHW